MKLKKKIQPLVAAQEPLIETKVRKLSSAELALLEDIFAYGGSLFSDIPAYRKGRKNQTLDLTYVTANQQNMPTYKANKIRKSFNACRGLFAATINKSWDFNQISNWVADLVPFYYVADPTDTHVIAFSGVSSEYLNVLPNDGTISVVKRVDIILKALARFCSMKGIIWDDITNASQAQAVKTTTMFGQLLDQFECYASQQPVPKATQQTAQQTTGSSSSATASTVPSKAGFRNTGSKLAQVNDVLNGGQKVYSNTQVFKIEVDGNPKIRVNLDPLSTRCQKARKNIINISNNNGFTTSACYFLTLQEANTFKTKIENDPTWSSTLSAKNWTLRVVGAKTDKNGYLLLDTDFGQCYYRACMVNEELQEEIEEEFENVDEASLEESCTKKDYVTWDEINEALYGQNDTPVNKLTQAQLNNRVNKGFDDFILKYN